MINSLSTRRILLIVTMLLWISSFKVDLSAAGKPRFRAIAFYTAKNDKAHISFVHEANRWFTQQAARYNFVYDSTMNWDDMNPEFLSQYLIWLGIGKY